MTNVCKQNKPNWENKLTEFYYKIDKFIFIFLKNVFVDNSFHDASLIYRVFQKGGSQLFGNLYYKKIFFSWKTPDSSEYAYENLVVLHPNVWQSLTYL